MLVLAILFALFSDAQEEPIPLWADMVSPLYYDPSVATSFHMEQMDWCLRPTGSRKEMVIEDVKVELLVAANAYQFHRNVNVSKAVACTMMLSDDQVNLFKSLIVHEFWYQYYVDMHPMRSFFGIVHRSYDQVGLKDWLLQHNVDLDVYIPEKIRSEDLYFLFTMQSFIFHTADNGNDITYVELVASNPRPISDGKLLEFTYSATWLNDGKKPQPVKLVATIFDEPSLFSIVAAPFGSAAALCFLLIWVTGRTMEQKRRNVHIWSPVTQSGFEKPTYPAIFAALTSTGVGVGVGVAGVFAWKIGALVAASLVTGLLLRFFQVTWNFRFHPALLVLCLLLAPLGPLVGCTAAAALVLPSLLFLPAASPDPNRAREFVPATPMVAALLRDIPLLLLGIVPFLCLWSTAQLVFDRVFHPDTSLGEWSVFVGACALLLILVSTLMEFMAEFLNRTNKRHTVHSWRIFWAHFSVSLFMFFAFMNRYTHVFAHLDGTVATTYRAGIMAMCVGVGLYQAAGSYFAVEMVHAGLRSRFSMFKAK
eukprot:GEMP01018681.1.p1 GENE.GEMP01018681.1~~GEMP01018681.1.p1  ORF type:complete len:536 (+),score=115.08 GEMP01018681.1:46-1653(+)